MMGRCWLVGVCVAGGLAAAECALKPGSAEAEMVDRVVWSAYWSRVPVAWREVTILASAAEVGVCAPWLGGCSLYSRAVEDGRRWMIDAGPYSADRAAGRWRKAAVPPAPAGAKAPLRAGGVAISDPLTGSKPGAAPGVAFDLTACTVRLSSSVPRAIAEQVRPQAAEGVLRAIENQGLAEKSRVLVPYFDEWTESVPIVVKAEGKAAEVLAVAWRGPDWWRFGPGEPSAAALIEGSCMVSVGPGRRVEWGCGWK